MEKLLLITTGGTIDGADSDTNSSRPESALYKYLLGNGLFDIDYHAPFNKDSREITDLDREEIFAIINSSSIQNILIGHGSYTICKTGSFLKSNLLHTDKLILLVCAWIPFNEPDSDAPKQASDASRFLQQKNKGVYIALDGKLWNPDVTFKAKNEDGAWCLKEK